MESAPEKPTGSKSKTKQDRKNSGSNLHRTFMVGDIEVSLWLGKTPTGIRYPQFSLSRVFTSDSSGRQMFTSYYDETNEAKLQEAVQKAVEATRQLREELLRGELFAVPARPRKTAASLPTAA